MKLIVLIALVAVAAAKETYTTENDDLDIEAIVADDDSLKSFFDCFVDKGSCNDVQASFKKDLPEAVKESCGKCTAAQKHIMKRFLEGLKEKFPEKYEEFKKKFDPEDKHFSSLETAVATA